jgi:plastocyanin
MRRLLLLGALALVLAVPPAVADSGQVRNVAIPGKAFAPGELNVLVGDTVVWQNGDSTNHTVTADDDSFDSGYLSPGSTFSRTFPKLGRYEYKCTIHKFMRGVITVVPVAFQGPGQPISAGGRITLSGLAPSGTKRVTVERLGGKKPRIERRVVPAGDGSFSVTLHARTPADFAAAIKGRRSRPVHIAVSPHVKVQPGAGRLVARVSPPRPGARAVLQVYVPELFTWRDVTRGRVDGSSHVSLPLPPKSRGHFRIVVRGGHGWASGASPAIVRP